MPQNLIFALGLTLGILAIIPQAKGFGETQLHVEDVIQGAEWLIEKGGHVASGAINKAPSTFLNRHGGRWTQRLWGPHGGFRQLWGEGIAIDPMSMQDSQTALAVTERFWRDNSDLLPLGVHPEDLKPWTNTLYNGIRFVSHRQTVDGVPVLGTSVFVAIMSGRIVLIGVRALPKPQVKRLFFNKKVSENKSRLVAQKKLSDLGFECRSKCDAKDPFVAYFPLISDDSISYRLVHAFTLAPSSGLRFSVYVDAQKGSLVALRDDRSFMNGTLQIRHHDRNPAGDLIESPMMHGLVSTGDGSAYTTTAGEFSDSSDTTSLWAEVAGEFVNVVSANDSKLTLDLDNLADGATVDWQDDTEFGQSQLDAYVFTTNVREYIYSLAPEVNWLTDPLTVNVNITKDLNDDGRLDYCNAWSDGVTINFLIAGGGCNNMASVSDVLYHEYGHGFHISSIIPGVGMFDAAVSEGFADTMSVIMTHDNMIGLYTGLKGWSIRDLEPNKAWPMDDVGEPHATGLIVGGALWDLRQMLVEEMGEVTGHAYLDELYVSMVKTATDVPSLWESTLLADDDNGNLGDGTPNFCTIFDAYNPHGLIGGEYSRLSVSHSPIYAVEQITKPISIEALITVNVEECNTLGQVQLRYSIDHGANWTAEQMESQSNDIYRGEIPAQPEGSVVFYRIEANEEESGIPVIRPYNIAEPYYQLYVGSLEPIVEEDFEWKAKDSNWVHEQSYGSVTESSEDWQWASPSGRGGDPDQAHSGDFAFGNDLATEEKWNGKYQSDKINHLTSPSWDLSEYETVRLRYRRWLTIEDGYFDKARIYVIVGDIENEVWINYASFGGKDNPHSIHHVDREWILHDVDITEWAAGQSDVRLRWEIESDQGFELGGWTIDDVGLYTHTTMISEPVNDGGVDNDGGIAPINNPPVTDQTLHAASGGCVCLATGTPSKDTSSKSLFALLTY